MSSNVALSVEQVAKTYHLYDTPQDRLKQMLFRGKRQYYRAYQALKPVSFSLPKGEVLGVVGRNGAGKSTLLQLICGTLTPSSGQIKVNGRIAALLELGAGFNPQFSGRENIYLAASIMGFNKQDIDAKLEDIIDFAGVRNFIDQPVSTYSSGMYVRLAFSVATSVEPDILIIDEALSVGDGDFARRSFERIMAMKERGATILFCSHSLYQIEVLCSQAIWLEKGELVKVGEPAKIVPQYQAFLDYLASHPEATPSDLEHPPQKAPEHVHMATAQASQARLTKIVASTPQGQGDVLDIVSGHTDLSLDIRFSVPPLMQETPQAAVAIHSAAGQLISSCGAWVNGVKPRLDAQGNGQIQITFPQLPLLKGTYYVGVMLFCQRGLFLHDQADPVVTLHVTQPNQERGIVQLPHTWQAPKASETAAPPSMQRQPSSRWQVRPAAEQDFEALCRVFEQSFAVPLDQAQWRWKYQHADSPGYVVLEQDQIVGFCGGAPRKAIIKGQAGSLLQLGDVMVAPKQRGILTKTGPFYRAAHGFLSDQIGQNRPYPYGFGFPNPRALQVGMRQGLYTPYDRILEASWPAAASHVILRRWQGEPDMAAQIDRLWAAMAEHLRDKIVGVRDANWLRYRYLEQPKGTSEVYLVVDANDAQCHAVMVVKDHPTLDQIELLDGITTPDHSARLIAAAQHYCAEKSRQEVQAWLTPSVLEWFAATEPQLRETGVSIPGNALDTPEHLAQAANRWWLMGGDSDFR